MASGGKVRVTDTFLITNFTITNFLPTLVSINTANRGIERIDINYP